MREAIQHKIPKEENTGIKDDTWPFSGYKEIHEGKKQATKDGMKHGDDSRCAIMSESVSIR